MCKMGDAILSGLLGCFVGTTYFLIDVVWKTARGYPVRRRHHGGGICTEWTVEALTSLAMVISAYVKPFVSYQQSKELEIKACTTADEVETVVINYDSVKA